jgi:integrase
MMLTRRLDSESEAQRYSRRASMARVKLTQAVVDRAELPVEGQRFLRDSQVVGLALRLTVGGSRTWIWDGRVKGRMRRVRIGGSPEWSLPAARQRAREMAVQRDKGEVVGPVQVGLTLGQLATRYDKEHLPRKAPKSATEDRRMLRDLLGKAADTPAPLPASWRARLVEDLTAGDVVKWHARLGEQRGLYAANRALALLRGMLNWARRTGAMRGENPAVHARAFREHSRERFLSPAEVIKLRESLDKEPVWGPFFLLGLLLGPRIRSELCGARWIDFDLKSATWNIPHTKAGRPHYVPLPSPALALLERLPSKGHSPWLFPSAKAKSGHAEEPGKAWARIRKAAGLADCRIHDLRRTLGSWMVAAGYSLPTVGKTLGHTQPSATAVYARMDVEPVRAALEAVSERMLR